MNSKKYTLKITDKVEEILKQYDGIKDLKNGFVKENYKTIFNDMPHMEFLVLSRIWNKKGVSIELSEIGENDIKLLRSLEKKGYLVLK